MTYAFVFTFGIEIITCESPSIVDLGGMLNLPVSTPHKLYQLATTYLNQIIV